MHLSGLSPGMNRYSSQPISYTVINSTRYLYECFPSAPKKKRRCLRAVHEPRCCFGLNLAQSLISSSTLVWSQTWYPALASSMCWWRWQPEALQLVCSSSSSLHRKRSVYPSLHRLAWAWGSGQSGGERKCGIFSSHVDSIPSADQSSVCR